MSVTGLPYGNLSLSTAEWSYQVTFSFLLFSEMVAYRRMSKCTTRMCVKFLLLFKFLASAPEGHT